MTWQIYYSQLVNSKDLSMYLTGFFSKANATCFSEKCAVVWQIKIWERPSLWCLPTSTVWWEQKTQNQLEFGVNLAMSRDFVQVAWAEWSLRTHICKARAIYFFYFMCVCICVPCACRSLWVLEEASDLLELELQSYKLPCVLDQGPL